MMDSTNGAVTLPSPITQYRAESEAPPRRKKKKAVIDDDEKRRVSKVGSFGSPTAGKRAEETPPQRASTASEVGVPLGGVLFLLRKRNSENFCLKLFFYSVFLGLFIAITMLARPTKSSYEMLAAARGLSALEAMPNANFEKTFVDVAHDGDWWDWCLTVLSPFLRSAWWTNKENRTGLLYNAVFMPVRFRQVRVKEDTCNTPDGNSEMARPCWGKFTSKHLDDSLFGEEYNNTFKTDMNKVSGKEGYGPSYGRAAHVVDIIFGPMVENGTDIGLLTLTSDNTSVLPDAGSGMPVESVEVPWQLALMLNDTWTTYATRAISVEAGMYNPNVDLAMYVRWHLDISPGGRVEPSILFTPCRLLPYSQPIDWFRLCLEVAFTCYIVVYWWIEFYEMRTLGLKAYFLSLWNWIELANLSIYLTIQIYWFAYLSFDRQKFTKVLDEFGEEFFRIADHYNFTSNLAAFNIIWAFIKVFKYLQMYPSMNTLWEVLSLSMKDTLPFAAVFLLFVFGFTFAAHWLYGFTLREFHSWGQSFSTLMQTLSGGLPYEDMKRFAPVATPIFFAAWILMIALVMVNMFVAILTDAHTETQTRLRKLEEIEARHTGRSALINFFQGVWRYITSFVKKRREAAGYKKDRSGMWPHVPEQSSSSMLDMDQKSPKRDVEAGVVEGEGGPLSSFQPQAEEDHMPETLWDYDPKTEALNVLMKKLDQRKGWEHVQREVLSNNTVKKADGLAPLFGGDIEAAREFAKRLNHLLTEGQALTWEEQREEDEVKMLLVLQTQVSQLHHRVRAVRKQAEKAHKEQKLASALALPASKKKKKKSKVEAKDKDAGSPVQDRPSPEGGGSIEETPPQQQPQPSAVLPGLPSPAPPHTEQAPRLEYTNDSYFERQPSKGSGSPSRALTVNHRRSKARIDPLSAFSAGEGEGVRTPLPGQVSEMEEGD
ncbi:unnamed protein product [Vitrella brassicaformis CCMP3155]|uniref:Uncharacterized protein n=2 Tax=Vitrella brassicaformis TaxID=1169539 RepID=A0A0G4FJE5_VITBC|nr:unnamed protein product [Vitrella brassicaformis CCMP3155]|eukprot:CEM13223.1 unnamed protein product [Vitrella brassicaformis CCMP3155]